VLSLLPTSLCHVLYPDTDSADEAGLHPPDQPLPIHQVRLWFQFPPALLFIAIWCGFYFN
jgi:hypothetical protein